MADTSNLTQFLTDVADAIRTKKETTAEIPAENFDTEILGIETGIDTSDATATVDDIINPKTAYIGEGKVTGSIMPTYEYVDATNYNSNTLNDTISTNEWTYNLQLGDYVFMTTQLSSSSSFQFRVIDNDNHIVLNTTYTYTDLGMSASFRHFTTTYTEIKEGDSYTICLVLSYNVNNKAVIKARRLKYDCKKNILDLEGDVVSSADLACHNNDVFISISPDLPNIVYITCSYYDYDVRDFDIVSINSRDTFNITTVVNGYNLMSARDNHVATGDGYGLVTTTLNAGGFDGSKPKYAQLNSNNNSVSSVQIDKLVNISHNFKYMIYGNSLCTCTKGDTASATYNSKKVIKSGLPSYTRVYFSKGDVYALLYNGNNGTVNVLSLETQEIVQTITGVYNSGFGLKDDCFTCSANGTSQELKLYRYTTGQQLIALEKQGIKYMDTSSVLTSTDKVLKDNTYFNNAGRQIGTMPNNGQLTYTPSDAEQTIPLGYTSGGKVKAMDITMSQDYKKCLALSENILGITKNNYIPLQYIQSTGTQYIDTGYVYNNDCKLVITGSDFSGACILHGSDVFAYNGAVISIGSNKLYWSYTQDTQITDNLVSKKTIETYRGNVTLDGTVVYSSKDVNTNTEFKEIRLFCDRGGTKFSKYKLYAFKIYDNNILVRDFIPVKETTTNKIGLYDKVHDRFLSNAGTGEFIGPELYTSLQYIETTGSQYINTNMIMNGDYQTEAKMQVITDQNNSGIFGCNYYHVSSYNGIFTGVYENGTDEHNIPGDVTKINVYIVNNAEHVTQVIAPEGTINSLSGFTYIPTLKYPCDIFARASSTNGESIFTKCIGRCYYFKITDNTTGDLLIDLIPVINNENNKVCMYDKVSNTFFYNSGTGEFISGGEV